MLGFLFLGNVLHRDYLTKIEDIFIQKNGITFLRIEVGNFIEILASKSTNFIKDETIGTSPPYQNIFAVTAILFIITCQTIEAVVTSFSFDQI